MQKRWKLLFNLLLSLGRTVHCAEFIKDYFVILGVFFSKPKRFLNRTLCPFRMEGECCPIYCTLLLPFYFVINLVVLFLFSSYTTPPLPTKRQVPMFLVISGGGRGACLLCSLYGGEGEMTLCTVYSLQAPFQDFNGPTLASQAVRQSVPPITSWNIDLHVG
jgi:hypothetical protein